MDSIFEQFYKIGIIPVVVLEDEKDAKDLAKALVNGGLPCAEVTFRTKSGKHKGPALVHQLEMQAREQEQRVKNEEAMNAAKEADEVFAKAAEEAIRIMSSECPELLVGAGTVLSASQAETAIEAGAKFIVSPGLNPEVVRYCVARGVPVTPGIQTPSEMEQAIELGLSVVKFFPAEPAGGLPMIKALAAPYTQLRFMPTGGINPSNVRDYLAFDKIIACGGSWMVKSDLVKGGQFDEIERQVREAADIVKEIRG